MKTAIAIGHGQNYEEDPQTTGLSAVIEGEEEDPEKKSVLDNVKDKGKKIKGTLRGNTHGPAVDGSDPYNDEDEPEVHGAPRYESAAAGKLKGQDESLRTSTVNESKTAGHLLNQDEISGQPTISVRSAGPLEKDPHVPKGRPVGFSPVNYQTKVADPIALGGEEAGIEPLLDHFRAVSFYQETNPGPTNPTGSTVSENPNPSPESPNESQPSITHHTTSTKAASARNTVSPKDGSAQNANDTPVASAPPVGPTGTVPDKGISVKEFVAEKLSPGDEDRALSEVISGIIRSRQEKKPEDVQDLPEDVYEKPAAKVSDSRKGVVERIKGAVGSLLRKVRESRASPGADCQSRDT